MKVEAYAAHDSSGILTKISFEMSPPTGFECIVNVSNSGLCHSDVSMAQNDWGMTSYPLVPGHEVIGEVVEVGTQVRSVSVGQRVGIGWQRSACLFCDSCLRGDENLCPDNQGTIVHGKGGFAEFIKVDSHFVFPIPEGIDSLSAGPLLCGGITVYSALRHAGMTGGQKIGVVGVGGLGHLAVQFAARLGNKVTVFTHSPDKQEFAAELGAEDAVLVTNGFSGRHSEQFDIILNTVNVTQDWMAYVNCLKADGTLAFVGVPPEPINLSLFPLLMKRRRIMASPIGGRAEMRDMLKVADQFGVKPVVQAFPIEKVNEAIRQLKDNQIRYRAVLTVG